LRIALRVTVEGVLVDLNFLVWEIVVDELKQAYFVGIPEDAYSGTVTDWVWSDGTLSTAPFLFPTYWDLPRPIPFGFVAKSGSSTIIWQTGSESCPSGSSPLSAAFIEEYSWRWNQCFEGYDQAGNKIYSWKTAHGLHIKNEYLFAKLDPFSTPPSPWVNHTSGTTLTKEQIEQRLRELLTSDDPDYKQLEAWLNSVLGGGQANPRDSTIPAPTCTGVTAATCSSRLRDAGFSGDINTEVVSADDAVMEQPAGEVVDTEPVLSTYLPETGILTLFVNPTPMPEMTSGELALAEQLQTQNPATITADNAKTIARRCSRTMINADKPSSTCSSLPLLVQGNDIKTPARNELVAQARNPAWVLLNRRTPVTRTAWYRGRTEPSPGCPLPTPNGRSCDEFPFWSTAQAFGGTLNGGIVPGIRYAPNYEQLEQSKIIGRFFGTKPPDPSLPVQGCDITAQPATATVPLPESTFATLGVPLGVRSTSACNRP
jgi:hypothetical protein